MDHRDATNMLDAVATRSDSWGGDAGPLNPAVADGAYLELSDEYVHSQDIFNDGPGDGEAAPLDGEMDVGSVNIRSSIKLQSGDWLKALMGWRPIKSGSIKGSVFSLANAVTGACILSVPYVLEECGVGLGLAVLLFCGMQALFTADLLLLASMQAKAFSYKQLSILVFGKFGQIFIDSALAFICMGSLIGYNVLFGRLTTILLTDYGVSGWWTHPNILMCAFNLVLVMPLAMLRSLQPLRYASMLSLVFLCYLVVVVAGKLIVVLVSDHSERFTAFKWYKLHRGILTVIPIAMFAFVPHINLFPVFSELQNPLLRRIRKVVRRSVFFAVFLYTVMALTGYFLFLDDTADNVLDNFVFADAFITVGRVCLLWTIMFSYPFLSFPCRASVDAVLFRSCAPSAVRSYTESFIIVMLALGGAVVVPNVKTVFGLVGATGGALVCYILPCFFYLKLVPNKPWWRVVGAVACLVFSALVGVASSVNICYDWYWEIRNEGF